jgi:uncharacterized protein
MNEQSNIDLVKQAYDAFAKGDIQRLLGLCAQDIEWELPEVEGIAFSGKRRGQAQVGEFFRLLDQLQETREFRPDEFIAQGERVVVCGHGAWTVRATGIEFSEEWVHLFTVTNGKLSKFKEYDDTHKAAQAYQPQPGMARAATTGAAAGRPPIH